MRSHLIGRITNPQQPLEPLVRRTMAHEPGAWEELWLVLDPRIETIARRWRVTGRLSASYDERRDIVVRVMASLRADGFRRLGKLHVALCKGEDAGRVWISRVIRREALDHVREHAEYLRGTAGDDRSRWASLVPLPDGVEDQLPDSVRVVPAVAAHEVVAYAEAHLEPEQIQALRLWLMGYEREDMALELSVADGKAADALVRAGLAALRYRFAGRGAARSSKNSF